jgi:hypothetical protein
VSAARFVQHQPAEAIMSKTIAAAVIALAMGVGGLGTAGQLGGVTDATKKAGQATKQVGKAAGETTKDAAKTTGKAAKKGATTTKNAVTGEARAKCMDGTHHTARTQKDADAACTHHGGVAKK